HHVRHDKTGASGRQRATRTPLPARNHAAPSPIAGCRCSCWVVAAAPKQRQQRPVVGISASGQVRHSRNCARFISRGNGMDQLFSPAEKPISIRPPLADDEDDDDDDDAAESLIREPVEKNRWSSIMIMAPDEPDVREGLPHPPPKPPAPAPAESSGAQGGHGNANGASSDSSAAPGYRDVGLRGPQKLNNNNTAAAAGEEDAITDGVGGEDAGDVVFNGVEEEEERDEEKGEAEESDWRGRSDVELTTVDQQQQQQQREGQREPDGRQQSRPTDERSTLVSGRKAGAGWARSG
ncbi:hypothetical protein GP486_008711, partial [Trichoglossum hirsutum]